MHRKAGRSVKGGDGERWGEKGIRDEGTREKESGEDKETHTDTHNKEHRGRDGVNYCKSGEIDKERK